MNIQTKISLVILFTSVVLSSTGCSSDSSTTASAAPLETVPTVVIVQNPSAEQLEAPPVPLALN